MQEVPFSYDNALARLEQLQKDLAADKIPIDNLEASIQEANDLIKKCHEKLIQIDEKLNLALSIES